MANKVTAAEALDALNNMTFNSNVSTAYIKHIQEHMNYAIQQVAKQLEFDLYGRFITSYVKIRRGKGFFNVKHHEHHSAKGKLIIKYEF